MNRRVVYAADRPEAGRERTMTQYAAYDRQLLRFCRKLTGTAWDAEDLAQTTWMKVWTMQLKRGSGEETSGAASGAAPSEAASVRCSASYDGGEPTGVEGPISSSYLYRIAANAWTDYCRRRTAKRMDRVEQLDELAEKLGSEAPPVNADMLQDAMERLIALLPPRQRIIVLLTETLRFTSAETAALLRMTEGAVKAALHRARETLSQARARGESAFGARRASQRGRGGGRVADEAIVYAYLEAFRTRNVQGLLQLLNAETASDVLPAVQGIQLAPPIRGKSGGGALRAFRQSAAPGGSCRTLAA